MTITSGGNCRTSNIIYAARCKICDLIYIGETGKELRKRFSDHRYDAKNRPDNNELAQHISDKKHDFEKDIEVAILHQGFKSQDERVFYEDKYICKLGTFKPNGMNEKIGAYAKEMYAMHQSL